METKQEFSHSTLWMNTNVRRTTRQLSVPTLKNVRKRFYDLYLFDEPAAATFASISAILDPIPLNSCDWKLSYYFNVES